MREIKRAKIRKVGQTKAEVGRDKLQIFQKL